MFNVFFLWACFVCHCEETRQGRDDAAISGEAVNLQGPVFVTNFGDYDAASEGDGKDREKQ